MKRIENFTIDGVEIKAEIFSTTPVHESGKDFGKQMDVMLPVIKGAKERIDSLGGNKPSEVTIEFGVTLGAEAGIIVSKASIEATLTVSVTWGS